MKKLLTKLIGVCEFVIFFMLLGLVAAFFLNRLPEYDQLKLTKGTLSNLIVSEEVHQDELGLTRDYYYFTLETAEGFKEFKSRAKYVQHIVANLQQGDSISIRAEKDGKNWWVWEIEKDGTLLLPFQERYAKEAKTNTLWLYGMLGGLGLAILLLLGSSLLLSFVYKLDAKALRRIILPSLQQIKEEQENKLQKILHDIQQQYLALPEFQEVDTKDFSHLDLKFYDNTMQALGQRGYHHLIDEENLTIKGTASDTRTFQRVALSDDGLVNVNLQHPKPIFWVRLLGRFTGDRHHKTITLTSEFSDGTFLLTSNAEPLEELEAPPNVFPEYLPANSTLKELEERHRSKMMLCQQLVPELSPLALRELDAVHSSLKRLQQQQAELRKRLGVIKEDVVEMMTGGDKELNAQVLEELRRWQFEALSSQQETTEPHPQLRQIFSGSNLEQKAKRLFNESFMQNDRTSFSASMIGTLLVVFPALSVTGFWFDSLAEIPLPFLLILSVVGSLCFFCFTYPRRKYWYLGILPGIFTGPLVFWAVIFYTSWRNSIWNIELAIPCLIGAAPGLLLWHSSLKRIVVRDLKKRLLQQQTEETERALSKLGQQSSPELTNVAGQPAPKVSRKPKETASSSAVPQAYHVVFFGDIAPGHQLEEVKQRVAALYKVPLTRCEHLFQGKKRIIKKNTDLQTAHKYKRTFEKTGAVCSIEEAMYH